MTSSGMFDRWAPRLITGLVVMVPLVFCLDMADTFDLPKLTLVYLSVAALLALWTYQQSRQEAIVWQRTPLDMPILLFLGSVILSTVFSIDRAGSFWGAYKIYVFGCLPILAFALLYVFTVQIATPNLIRRIQTAALYSASLVSLYGLMQYSGYEIFQRMPSVVGGRVWSSLGNPLYMGAVCMMAVPLALNRFRGEQGKPQWGMLAVLMLLVLGLALSLSRSAWLAVVCSTVLVFFVGAKTWQEKKVLFGAVVCALILMCLLPQVRARATDIVSMQEASNAARVAGWKSGIRAWKASLWIGAGTDTFFQAFRPFRDLDFIRAAGPSVTQADAHNDLIQMAATQGLVGVLAYFVLLGAFLWQARKRWADPLYTGLLAALIALAVQNQFNFSAVTTSAWAAIFMGLCMPRRPTTLNVPPMGQRALAWSWLGVLAALVGLTAPLRADISYKEGLNWHQNGRSAIALPYLEKAVRLQGHINIYKSEWVNALRNVANLTPNASSRDRYLDRAWTITDRAAQEQSHNPDLWNNRGVVAMWLVQLAQHPLEAQARESFEKAIALDPVFVDAWANLAKWEHLAGHLDKEKELWRKVLALDPQHPMALQVLGLNPQ